ncbi:hypothetical protein [Tessaracoccus coleopterorum]|uniref:hypothetical protein n=1 Tax=Tessaracoccus coleopterorum TaxID=2714950 RepID=UPI0022B250BB|nr:hypothetical protein [Tessaracoccus coleopterorum]
MFKPTAKVVDALRSRVAAADLAAELDRRRPDLTALLLRAAADGDAPLGRELTAAVCRAACGRLGELHPGRASRCGCRRSRRCRSASGPGRGTPAAHHPTSSRWPRDVHRPGRGPGGMG